MGLRKRGLNALSRVQLGAAQEVVYVEGYCFQLLVGDTGAGYPDEVPAWFEQGKTQPDGLSYQPPGAVPVDGVADLLPRDKAETVSAHIVASRIQHY